VGLVTSFVRELLVCPAVSPDRGGARSLGGRPSPERGLRDRSRRGRAPRHPHGVPRSDRSARPAGRLPARPDRRL